MRITKRTPTGRQTIGKNLEITELLYSTRKFENYVVFSLDDGGTILLSRKEFDKIAVAFRDSSS